MITKSFVSIILINIHKISPFKNIRKNCLVMSAELYTMSKFLWVVLNELQHWGIIQFKAVEDPCKMASLTA